MWELEGGGKSLRASPMDVEARGTLEALTLTRPLVWRSQEGRASLEGNLRAPKGAGLAYDFAAETDGDTAKALVAVIFNCTAATRVKIQGPRSTPRCL